MKNLRIKKLKKKKIMEMDIIEERQERKKKREEKLEMRKIPCIFDDEKHWTW